MFYIRLFGAIEIESDGEVLTAFRSQKALALLAYLISENRAVTRDYLAGLAWPESSQKQALGLLRRSLHSLSSQLPGCLEIDRRTVRWRADAPARVDIYQFERLASSRENLDLAEGVRLYRAPYLEGVYLDDCPEFERWLVSEQQRWHQRVVQMLMSLIASYTEQAEYEQALAYARRLLVLEPWHEGAHRETMMLLARTGRTEAALAQFDQCLTILETELGTAPVFETEQTLTRILALQRTRLHPLPAPTTTFVGREVEVAEIAALLRGRASRLLTVLGPGGMGKTRLAVQVARHLTAENMRYFLHGIAFVAAGRVDDSNALIVALADALGLSLQQGEDPGTQLLAFLHDKELLLVLDEFEALIETETLEYVTQLLAQSPNLTLLVTSRRALNMPAERLHPLAGLSAPNATQPTDASSTGATNENAAAQLFVETARRVHPTFAASDQAKTAIDELCQLVDGMPLAIELAAAWSTVLIPEEITVEIRESLDFLGSDAGNRPARHASMRAVIESSWRHLAEPEQQVLERLSVFHGGFTHQAATKVAGATPAILASLLAKSMLSRRDSDRFFFHPLVGQYGSEMLFQSDQRAATAEKYGVYFSDKLRQWADDYKGPSQRSGWYGMTVERDNILAAWEWAVQNERLDLLLPAMDGMGAFHRRLGHYDIGEAAFLAANQMSLREAANTPYRSTRRQHRLILGLTWQATFAIDRGALDDAYELLAQAQAIVDRADEIRVDKIRVDEKSIQETKLALAIAFFHLKFGQLLRNEKRTLADAHYRHSLMIYTAQGDSNGMANALLGKAQLERERGNYGDAQAYAHQALSRYQLIENRAGMANAYGMLGLVDMDLGEMDSASNFLRNKLDIFRDLDDPFGIANALDNLGLVGLFRGEFELASQWFEQSMAIHEVLGRRHSIGIVTTWSGISQVQQAQYGRGHSLGLMALTAAEEVSDQWAIGHARMLLGYSSLLLGQTEDASQHLDTAVEIFQQLGQQDELGQSYGYLAYVELALHNWKSAQAHVVQALQQASITRTILPILIALPAVARLFVIQEEPEMAVEMWAQAAAYPMIANSAMMEELSGGFVRPFFESLPQSAVDAAKERSSQRDLHETAEVLLSRLAG